MWYQSNSAEIENKQIMTLLQFLSENKQEVFQSIQDNIMEQKRIGETLSVSQVSNELIKLEDFYQSNLGHKFLVDELVAKACDKAILTATNFSEINEANIAALNRQKATFLNR